MRSAGNRAVRGKNRLDRRREVGLADGEGRIAGDEGGNGRFRGRFHKGGVLSVVEVLFVVAEICSCAGQRRGGIRNPRTIP